MSIFCKVKDYISNLLSGEQRGLKITFVCPGHEYHLEKGVIVRGTAKKCWVYFPKIEVLYGPVGQDVDNGLISPN